ncbi:MAG: hotdog domain-containing protein [Brachybacterium sp.]|nr:hotdog domain-containing protein [Brachybacterium sp.]
MARRSTIELTFHEVQGTSAERAVPGGTVVDWIDRTAYACAASWARADCVTSYVGNMHFTTPVPKGRPVTVQARLVHTGTTSVHIQARVLVRRGDGSWEVVTECMMIYVAVDSEGRPTAVEPFVPSTEREVQRDVDAVRRIASRRRLEETIHSLPEGMGTSEALTLRFLADSDERYPDGKIRGGEVMRWIDQAAQICAERYCGYTVVAALTGGVRFYRPVRAGDLVEVDARLVLTAPTSLHVLVSVRSGSHWEKRPEQVAYGLPVMFAPDGEGSPRHITPWQPITDEDHAVAEKARRLREQRNALMIMPNPVAMA